MPLNQESRSGEIILDYLRGRALNPTTFPYQNETKGDLIQTEEKTM